VRAFAKVERESLVERVEASLRKLGFSYLKNRGRTVTGLEVQSPCHFIVTVEDLTKPQLGYPLRERFRIESAIQIVRTPGSKETESEVKRGVSALVQDLCSDLPDKRWNGLLDLKSLAEKDSWKA
jgi:hypothetical protein